MKRHVMFRYSFLCAALLCLLPGWGDPPKSTNLQKQNTPQNDIHSASRSSVPRSIQQEQRGDTVEVFLIPNRTTKSVDMFDPQDGTFLGSLIFGYGLLFSPFNAIVGPGGYIYVADHLQGTIYRYDPFGRFIDTYADKSDGLDNIYGMDIRNGHVFVITNDFGPYNVAEFDGPHNRLPDFIHGLLQAHDILFLPDGGLLLSWGLKSPDIRRYDSNGNYMGTLFTLSSAQPAWQIRNDPLLPGSFLCLVPFSLIYDFELDGTISEMTPNWAEFGIARLGNGNLLDTSKNGVYEREPGTGNFVEEENTGWYYYIEKAVIQKPPLYADAWSIDSSTGGQIHFTLNGGPSQANRHYIIMAGLHGITPGTPLPGGKAVMPVNWDYFTNLELSMINSPIFKDFMGTLDSNGKGSAVFDTITPVPILKGYSITFAYALAQPYDYASNTVNIKIK